VSVIPSVFHALGFGATFRIAILCVPRYSVSRSPCCREKVPESVSASSCDPIGHSVRSHETASELLFVAVASAHLLQYFIPHSAAPDEPPVRSPYV
jgi:hypothetical protein